MWLGKGMALHSSTSLLLCLLTVVNFLEVTALQYSLSEPPSDIKVSPWDGTVFVSAGRTLIRLDPKTFAIIGTDEFIGGRLAISLNYSDTFMACTDEVCNGYHFDTWPAERLSLVPIGRVGLSTTLVPSSDGSFYVGSSNDQSIIIKHYDDLYIFLREFSERVVINTNFYRREFLYAFEHGSFVYFVVRDYNGTDEDINGVRIMRVCHEPDSFYFGAAYEAVLDCGEILLSSNVTMSESSFDNSTIVLSVKTNGNTKICLFSTEAIDTEMDNTYTSCINGQPDQIISLFWFQERICGDLQAEIQVRNQKPYMQ